MESSTPVPFERPVVTSFGEFPCTRITPTPADTYRCPVSTPSNFVQRHSRIRRTKPMGELDYGQSPIISGRQQRSKGMALTRHNRNFRPNAKIPLLQGGNSLKYYLVDHHGDKKEEEHTNTHWLKALCSQPVDEILNKYRRKSDVARTRVIWCKTFTTPGERSLLSAWENNIILSNNRRGGGGGMVGGGGGRTDAKSEYFGDSVRGESAQRRTRQTQSEPALSRANHLDLMSGSISPVSPRREAKTPMDVEQRRMDLPETNIGSTPRRKVKEFLSNDPSGRVSSYVTQYFAPKGRNSQSRVYSKVVTSPELLPELSSEHKISNMSKERYNVSFAQLTPEIAEKPPGEDSVPSS